MIPINIGIMYLCWPRTKLIYRRFMMVCLKQLNPPNKRLRKTKLPNKSRMGSCDGKKNSRETNLIKEKVYHTFEVIMTY